MENMRELIEIEATEGDEFMQYMYDDGTFVPYGEVIGWEYEDADENDEIILKDGIFYASEERD